MARMKIVYVLGLFVLIGIATFGIINFSSRTVVAQEALAARIPPELRNYRIAYLVDSTAVEATSLRAPVNVQQITGAQVAASWEQVTQMGDLSAIIIDRTATHMIDRAWLANAYRNGLVVSMFNVYASEMGELIGNPCLSRDSFASEPYPSDFYVTSSFLILGNTPSDIQRAAQHYAVNCSDDSSDNVTGFVTGSVHSATEQFTDAYGLEAFSASLLNSISSVATTRQHFANSETPRIGQ